MNRLEELRIQAKQIAEKMSQPNINYSYLEMLQEAKVRVSNELRELEIKLGLNK